VALAPVAGDPRFPWPEALREAGRAAGAALAAEGAEGRLALAVEAARRLSEMLRGIERWQTHPHVRALPEPPTLWSVGAARLLDHAPCAPRGAPVVLVVPSLVNSPAVLDLHPRRSLLRALAAAGLRPLLLDWGAPGPAERRFDLDAYHRARLLPAARVAAELNGGPAAALGYCMGGAFAAALAAQRPDLVSRLALIGAPWDFSRLEGPGRLLAALVRREGAEGLARALDALGAAFGAAPTDLLQTLFAALDPTLALRKFRAFARLDPASTTAEIFVAAEDWLNDGPPLAVPAAKDIALGWYLENAPARGEWRLAGEPVRPELIRRPTLAFCSASDRIAPPDAAEALPRAIPGARLLRPSAGHVGMIVGSAAAREVWAPLAAFLAER